MLRTSTRACGILNHAEASGDCGRVDGHPRGPGHVACLKVALEVRDPTALRVVGDLVRFLPAGEVNGPADEI